MRFLHHLRRSVALGLLQANTLDKILLTTKIFFAPITRRLKWGWDAQQWLCKKHGIIFHLHFDGTHETLLTICEILCFEEYETSLDDPKVIFDIGANIGLATIFFATKYPEAKIFSFEPAPNAYGFLKKNAGQFSNVIVFNIALSDSDGEIDFYVNEAKSIASSIKNRDDHSSSIKVPSWSFDTAVKKCNVSKVDLVKFDIEGAEYDLFQSASDRMMIKNLTGEIHEDLMTNTKDDFVSLFQHLKLHITPANKKGRFIVNT